MASSFTPNYNLEKPANGDDVNTWDVPVNGNSNLLDQILGTVTTISLTNANVNLTLSQQQNATIKLTGSISANIVIYFLAGRSGKWIVRNATTGNYTVTLQNANIKYKKFNDITSWNTSIATRSKCNCRSNCFQCSPFQ